MDPVLAISLQAQVEKYGAYVGIAAFFGLAVLTLLYFAQAREVKRLREWAGREPERVQEAALARANQLTGTEAASVASAPQAATSAGAVAAPALAPAAASSVTSVTAVPAPATAAGGAASSTITAHAPSEAVGGADSGGTDEDAGASGDAEGTDEAPTVGGSDAGAEPAAGERPAGAVAAQADAPGEALEANTSEAPAAPPSGDVPDAEPDPEPAEEPDPEPAHDASVNGAADAPPPPPATAIPIPAPRPVPAPMRAAPAVAARPASRTYGAAAAARRPIASAPPATPPRARSGSGRTAIAAIGALVTLAALVFAGTQLFGGAEEPAPRANVVSSEPTPAAPAGTDGGGRDAQPSSPTSRARTQVAVFNGTTTTGLALSMAERLQSRGYPEGAKTGNFTPDPTAPDQLRSTSTVYYADGQRAQARDVGRLLEISELKPIDDDLQSLAPQAKVLVIVGADKTR